MDNSWTFVECCIIRSIACTQKKVKLEYQHLLICAESPHKVVSFIQSGASAEWRPFNDVDSRHLCVVSIINKGPVYLTNQLQVGQELRNFKA